MPADQHVSEQDSAAEAGSRPSVIVRPVVNAIRIMRLLAYVQKPQTAAQIASIINLNRSTCFNILKTLTEERAIDFDKCSKTYSMLLGSQEWQAGLVSEQQRLAAARRLMRAVSSHFSVTVSLWKRLHDDRLSLVAVEHSSSAIRIHMAEGQRVPILMGSSGRALAPHLRWSRKVLQEQFNMLRWQRPISFDEYYSQVQQAATSGYGIDEGYFAHGVTSVGVAVLDDEQIPRYSATAIMFQGQHDAETITSIGKAMQQLSSELQDVLT